ncbi:unnamed protein product [Rotaria sordida]|uniref:Uncharacterized protein n=1 Tax=Rotaria sordida TaxID=392033 RepID=A0A813ZUZ0_9BILA|nr:unnamed protein product [Rotaria sordida]CAF0990017.1 unnamed protein product [Rotaria sordida]CAF1329025.1 unnamed protein product [Rotaria sordida]
MKQLRTQQHSHHNSKAWTSLDCLLTSFPVTPLSRSSIIMRSNGNVPMTDSRRISPQTTSSSGYHSDLSSATPANQSPQSIHEILPNTLEKSSLSTSSSLQLQEKTISITNNSTYDKLIVNKNLSRISSFIRRQYERAKSKFISKPLLSSSSSSSQVHVPKITTCSKATSTTPITHLSEDNSISLNKQEYSIYNNKKPYYHQNNLSSVYQQSSFTEPVYSIDLYPSHNHQVKLIASHQHKNYASIHDCYSHQPSYGYSTKNNSHQYSTSYRRLATMANLENNNYNMHRHQYYPFETLSSQNYYPYQYTNNNYDYNRSNYVPLSDFISTKNSAFKPIGQKQKQKQFYSRPSYNMFEQVPPSDDPCDLEVAHYFPQTSQWSNPNYFDIYSKDINVSKQTYTETLC